MDEVPQEVRHQPERPSWDCTGCAEPWPCPDRRAQFLNEYVGRRAELRMILGAWFVDAVQELVVPVEDLHARFFGWAKPGQR